MNKETIKRINKMVEEANCVVIATENEAAVVGSGGMILTCLASLIKSIRTNMPDELVRESVELGFLSDEELEKRTKESIEKVLGDTENLKKLGEMLKNLFK